MTDTPPRGTRALDEAARWMPILLVVLAGWLVYLLAPILTPFVLSALLAYIGDPLVDRLEERGLGRTSAVAVVFGALLLLLLALLLVFVPLLEQQVAALVRLLPQVIDWVQNEALGRVGEIMGWEPGSGSLTALRDMLTENWQKAGGFAVYLLGNVSQSGLAVLAWLGNVVLVPVVTFYLLRDWDLLVTRVRDLLPRRVEPKISELAGECDAVLAEFLRGQVLVMTALGVMYTLGLWIIGLDLALLVGVISGLVSFVPYMGFLLGILLAGVAAFFQFQELMPLLGVAVVFGIGQAVESMVLTPLLVGDRIGLHPVAVIFAVLAGGQLFGFLGVLLALPVAAVVVVVLRHVHEGYLDSEMYKP